MTTPEEEPRTKLYIRLFVVLALIGWVLSWDGGSPSRRDPEIDRSIKEYSWMEKGKDSVREILRDPDGAKFSDVFFHKGPAGIPVACGFVNAKNGFGGYSGRQRFISAGRADRTYLEEQVDNFSDLWMNMCQK